MDKAAILVTGSSSGIGLETAVHLAAKGFNVYATMRDLGRRQALDSEAAKRNVALNVRQLDTTDAESTSAVLAEIAALPNGLYAVVNNAGSILRGYFEDVSESEMRRVYDTNVFGTMAVTRACLPLFRKARSGRVVVVSSTGGRLGSPGNSAYCSSKFALEGFGESLRQEMAPFGVFVSLVEPGFVRTELFGRNRQIAEKALAPDSGYREIFLRLEAFTDQQVRRATTPASAVAETIFRALTARSPRIRYVVGRRARFLLSLRRHLPGEFFDRIWIREITKRLSEAKSTR